MPKKKKAMKASDTGKIMAREAVKAVERAFIGAKKNAEMYLSHVRSHRARLHESMKLLAEARIGLFNLADFLTEHSVDDLVDWYEEAGLKRP